MTHPKWRRVQFVGPIFRYSFPARAFSQELWESTQRKSSIRELHLVESSCCSYLYTTTNREKRQGLFSRCQEISETCRFTVKIDHETPNDRALELDKSYALILP